VDPNKLKAPLPRRPRDEAEAKAVSELEQILGRYDNAHRNMADTVVHLLTIEAEQGKRRLEAHYSHEIDRHSKKARELRTQALERYKAFLKQHPNHPVWTPEMMFRLAELHFEQSSETFNRENEAYEKALAVYQEKSKDDPKTPVPVAPLLSYEQAIGLFGDVVRRFPHHPYNDAALYMMGTLLYDEERFDESRHAYLALACADRFEPLEADFSNVSQVWDFKPGDYQTCASWKEGSRFAEEAWLRVGELHYDFDEFEPALEAYAQAAKDREGELYDEALIRIAWTLYLKRDFPKAARTFDDFIQYADARLGKGKVEGAIQLRDDAVKYLAKTYVEEDWDGNGRRDRVWGFERLERDYSGRNEAFVPEVYTALGDLFAWQTEFAKAIQIWEATLRRWPLSATAPEIQRRVLEAYVLLNDKDGATRARDKLATEYLRGTKWFYANESNPDALEKAMRLAEEALVATALDHHARAQALRSQGDPGAAREYAIAAKAYEAYLERFPTTQASYEYRYNFAESLYYSGQLLKAARAYIQVRDSNLDNRLQEDAASGVVSAYEEFVEAEKKAGRLKVPDMPRKGMLGPFDKPKEIPKLLLALQGAYDDYLDVRPDSEQAPNMKYLAGEISQRYLHFDDAERRFVQVLDDHCEKNTSINAGKAIVEAYIVREDLKAVQKWTDDLVERGCGAGEEGTKFAGELKTIGRAVRFQEATLLFEKGEFEAAADRYVALVDQAPDDANADRALFNAASAYERIGRYGSASKTYRRIFTNYPDSEFADNALLRTGYNHIRFFEYEEGVKTYLILAEDRRYANSEFRDVALENAADLLESLQQYKRSAALFESYSKKTEDQAKAAESLFRAAEVVAKTGHKANTIRAYRKFLKVYGGAPSQTNRALEAHLKIGKVYESVGKRRKAEKEYRATTNVAAARGLKPASEGSAFPAEAQFLLAEYALSDLLKARLRGTGKKLENEAKKLFDRAGVAAKAYERVWPYRNLDWTLASMYRRGYAFETIAIRMREAPVPKRLKQYSEPWLVYKEIVANQAQRFENEAIMLYEETVKRAKEYSFANEWTRGAQERLNIYKPEEYPLLRQPALDLQLEDLR
jgi:TolA-binding protein